MPKVKNNQEHEPICRCGCGKKTAVLKYANRGRGYNAGDSRRYIKGHEHRMSPHGKDYIVGENGCWVWQLATNKSGYATTHVGGKTKDAHRVYYESLVGLVKKGLELDHLCRNRKCVNPQHMEQVTHAENMKRSPKVTKLSDKQVCAIRELEGVKTQTYIAKMFGISQTYVGQLHRREWRKDTKC